MEDAASEPVVLERQVELGDSTVPGVRGRRQTLLLENRLDIVKEGRVRFLDSDTGNAMSMPNPVTIPWAIDKFSEQL